MVLAYHGIGEVERVHDPDNLMLAPQRFRQQVLSLKERGYRFLTITDFASGVRDGAAPAGCCALTFDDGSSDGFSVLPGLLDELGVPATLFVCPGLLGSPHFSIAAGSGVRLLSAGELADLALRGDVEIGSHTRDHRSLASATRDEALVEMRASREALEQLVGKPVTSFAYPGCAYSPACPGAAAEAGYVVAATCAPAGGWRPFELRRESIDTLDGRLTFALKSRGLWEALYASAPGRLGRRAARLRRHSGQEAA